MKNNIKENKGIYLILMCLIILQIVMVLAFSSQREYLFCDEVYSYGLANSVDKTFLTPKETEGNWVKSDTYTSYTLYQDIDGFSFVAPYVNQDLDVHPPLYYMFIHVFSRLFQRNNLDVLPGVLLNIVFLVLADVLMLYISSYLFEDRCNKILPLIVWGISSACISNCIFLRMYMMQTAEILLFIFFHVFIIKHTKKMNFSNMFVFTIIVAIGGLTHYYFYVYAGAFAFCVCIYLIMQKKYIDMLKYGISLVVGILCAIFAFPSTLSKHIFSYRGSETIDAVGGLDVLKFTTIIDEMLSEEMGDSIVFLVLLAIVLIVVILKRDQVIYKERNDNRKILFIIMTIASILFLYFVVQGSQSGYAIRYLYPIMAIFSFITAYMIIRISRCFAGIFGKSIALIIALVLPILSLFIHGIDWMYKDFKKSDLEAVANTDAIALYDPDIWSDVYSAIVALNVYDEIVFVPIESYKEYNYNDLIKERFSETEKISIIIIPSVHAKHYFEEQTAIDKIVDDLGYKEAVYVAGFDWLAYKLIEE